MNQEEKDKLYDKIIAANNEIHRNKIHRESVIFIENGGHAKSTFIVYVNGKDGVEFDDLQEAVNGVCDRLTYYGKGVGIIFEVWGSADLEPFAVIQMERD